MSEVDHDSQNPVNKDGSQKEGKESIQEKKRLGEFLGYEVSVPEGTKNPVLRLIILLSANILLLVLFKILISREG